MFGIKKLQKDIEDLTESLFQLTSFIHQKEKINSLQFHDTHLKLDTQKLELSKINTRFHDLGIKIDRTQSHIDKLAEYGIKMSLVDDKLMNKLVTDEAVLSHITEFNKKINVIFTYMDDLEKVMCNVDTIIEQCLPEKTLKLPKKKKATTAAS